MKEASEFVEILYLRIRNLENIYDEIVAEVPNDWQIPIGYINALKLNLFNKNWLDETKTSFL